jgi:hypothetical protein
MQRFKFDEVWLTAEAGRAPANEAIGKPASINPIS